MQGVVDLNTEQVAIKGLLLNWTGQPYVLGPITYDKMQFCLFVTPKVGLATHVASTLGCVPLHNGGIDKKTVIEMLNKEGREVGRYCNVSHCICLALNTRNQRV